MTSISSTVYDREYFLSEKCEGWDRFSEDRGLSRLKLKQVRALRPEAGVRILDAGCGRGEVLLACARAGAEVAGIDYSEAAVELSRETLDAFPDADIRAGELTALPWADGSFDRVLCGDVIEHIDPELSIPMLRELCRVLRPEGLLVLHTAPNRLFVKVTWPVARVALRLLGRGGAAGSLDAWLEEAEAYHVNEQSVYSLRRSLAAAGFARSRVWIDPDVLRSGDHFLTSGLQSGAVGMMGRLAGARPLRVLLGNDVCAVAWAP